MLPNFLVIGAQKAGSSWFTECLGAHPDIYMHPREVYFFNREFDRGVGWYEDHFREHRQEPLLGEGTPGYIYHPEAPDRIRATLGPDVKLIASLRHPVDRAYSAFWNFLTSGRIDPDADFEALFRDSDLFEMKTRGFYAEQLERVLAVFPREQVRVFVQEEDLRRGPETLRACFAFLGVDPDVEAERSDARVNANKDMSALHAPVEAVGLRVARLARKAPPGVQRVLRGVYEKALAALPTRRAYAPLEEAVRERLFETYRDDVARLEALLERDLSVWRRPRGGAAA